MHYLQTLLKTFNSKGYAEHSAVYLEQPDKSKRLELVDGDYKYIDFFWGGEPYGGTEMIFFQEKPILYITYYGWVRENADFGAAYTFLRNSLKEGVKSQSTLHRGPECYKEGDYVYTNSVKGTIENFELVEKIFLGEVEIYSAKFMGGLVDVQK